MKSNGAHGVASLPHIQNQTHIRMSSINDDCCQKCPTTMYHLICACGKMVENSMSMTHTWIRVPPASSKSPSQSSPIGAAVSFSTWVVDCASWPLMGSSISRKFAMPTVCFSCDEMHLTCLGECSANWRPHEHLEEASVQTRFTLKHEVWT